MTFRASKALLLTAAAALTLPACATVDIAEMAAPAARAETQAEVNIVSRAVSKLKAAFTQRGFGPKASKRKMHAAADVLLNGINSEAAGSAYDYNSEARSVAVVTADILVAKRHVDQTTRAAEIYLEMAPTGRDLGEELSELEAALLVSEKACKVFAEALDGADMVELDGLKRSVDGLRDVTDAFGFRVRLDRSAANAPQAAS